MLTVGQSNRVTFNVNVMGTKLEPSVRVVLAATPELTFHAVSVGDGSWAADLAIPPNVQAGSYDLRVEVVLNNRLFTPLHKKIEVQGAQPDPIPQPAPPIAPAPLEPPKEEPRSSILRTTTEPSRSQPTESPDRVQSASTFVQPPVVTKPPKVQLKPRIAPSLEALAAAATVQSKPAVKPLNLKPAARRAPVSVRISEIAAESSKFDEALRDSPSYVRPKATTITAPAVESRIPIRLVKGEIIYE